MSEYGYYLLFASTQLIHSQEEIWTDFHKRWFIFTMPRWLFVSFEAVFSAIILLYAVWPHLSFAHQFMTVFAWLMLANGLEHIIWAIVEKRYVPGLITAPLFLIIFGLYIYKWSLNLTL